MVLLRLLAIAYSAGPLGAFAYGSKYFEISQLIFILFLSYTLPLPLVFYIFGKTQHESNNIIIKTFVKVTNTPVEAMQKITKVIIEKFRNKWGHFGYYMSLAFLSFVFGFLWAAILAYLFGFERKRAYASIAIGTIMGLAFWSGVFYLSIKFITAELVFIIVLSASGASLLAGKVHEKQVLLSIKKDLEKVKLRKRHKKRS